VHGDLVALRLDDGTRLLLGTARGDEREEKKECKRSHRELAEERTFERK
jgi:hypothetical protein